MADSPHDAVTCGHCGREIPPHQRAFANGVDLCHTGTIPPGEDPPDCYRAVTIYRHSPDGSCCRERAWPWHPGIEPEEFDGCSRACRVAGKHTLKWGDCERAEEPPPQDPEFGFWRTFDAGDGCMSISMASIPFLAVLPWAKALTVEERHRVVEEAARAEDPAATIAGWRLLAQARNSG